MKKIFILVSVAAAFAMQSCTTRLIDFTVISSKNVTLRAPDDARGPRTSGKDVKFCGTPNLKEATDRAIQKAGPQYDALIDGVVNWKNYYFSQGYEVVGTPINTKKLKSSE